LVSLAYQVVTESGRPFIIAGDFNTSVDQLPVFSIISDDGHVEIFSWYKSRGLELPPTCKGATRNDTCIIHRDLAQLVNDVQIECNPAFDAHSPMLVTLDLQKQVDPSIPWKVPRSWAGMDVRPDMPLHPKISMRSLRKSTRLRPEEMLWWSGLLWSKKR
jgi:hypothetical protein